ncbi:hypothetical protein ZEAMMB73_Zm00001d025855 [Zea mays]|uniref:Uncharacterized protein n=1 Tax=Zea mays TaxID=4577 RepID=A0A1D6JAE4_MAIZE|nr:hypothetical protein ZEAMMB73_Zm00001d025855 [Zea mays]
MQESGGLEDEELQVQDAVASGSKRSKDSAAAATRSANVSSPSVVHSHPAILPAPAQQIPEVKQADTTHMHSMPAARFT